MAGTRPLLVRPPMRTLLEGAIDYAGLFPPAALALDAAARNYAAYLRGGESWALGRFIVPAARLEELSALAPWEGGAGARPWRISALAGQDVRADAAHIDAFDVRHEGVAAVDSVEARASSSAAVEALRATFGETRVYVELPLGAALPSLLDQVRAAGLRAKIRTGGVTEDAFPSSRDVAAFLRHCVARAVPFKATAGLHHPVRGRYPLTYAADAPRATMFGYLNIFMAAALARGGGDEPTLIAVLEEGDPSAFVVSDSAIAWRSEVTALESLRAMREEAALAFGSCSFREPLDEIDLLPSS